MLIRAEVDDSDEWAKLVSQPDSAGREVLSFGDNRAEVFAFQRGNAADPMPDSNIAILPAIATHPVEGVARFGSGGSRTSVAGSCAVLWPATVMFVLTGNAGSALAVAGVAWVLRHVWEGGARSAAPG